MKAFSLLTAAALTATTAFVSISQVEAAALHIEDHSFEQATGSLSNGVLGLGAEYSKTIGGWHYQRGSLLGLLPPNTGSYNSSNASDGNNVARISSLVGVAGAATVSQQLTGQGYAANTRYTLEVDVYTFGVAEIFDAAFISLTSNGSSVAHSGEGALVSLLDLGSGWNTWSLVFETGDSTPTGDIGIRLGTFSLVDLVSTIAFDNVRLDATALSNGGDPSVVPSPAAAPLVLMGLGALGFRRRRNLM